MNHAIHRATQTEPGFGPPSKGWLCFAAAAAVVVVVVVLFVCFKLLFVSFCCCVFLFVCLFVR